MAYDGVMRPEEECPREDMLYGINAAMADQRQQYMEEVPEQHEVFAPEHLASDFAMVPGQEEANGATSPKGIPSPVVPTKQALLRPSTQNGQPVEDERDLSVWKSRKMPRPIPQLTRPALLGPQPGDAMQPMQRVPSKVVPPVLPVSVPTPVSIIRPRAPEFTAPLNLPPRDDALSPAGQITAMLDGGDSGERSNDPSPTKTERFRKVKRWAQEAATARPPLVNEAQNDSQEAALRRDEDRLDIAAESLSTPPQFERQLPSIPHMASPYAHDTTQPKNKPPPAEDIEEQTHNLPGGLATFEGPEEVLLTPRIDHNDDCRSAVPAELPMEERNPTSEGKAPTPERMELDRAPVLPTEPLQQLQSIHDTVQALHLSHESSQRNGTFKEAVMANTDESKEILAKTNVLLGMISAIHERLAGSSTTGGTSPVAVGDVSKPIPGQRAEKAAEGPESLDPKVQAGTTTSPSPEPELVGISHVGEETMSTENQQVSVSDVVASRLSTK